MRLYYFRFLQVLDLETNSPTKEPGRLGEIWIYCLNKPAGYYRYPVGLADESGWIDTGDVGYLDEKGCIHLTDRSKDVLKYKGQQVKT